MNKAILAAVTGGVMLAAGCGGPAHSDAANNGGKTPYQQAVAYAQCMRQHGDPAFPDPGPGGAFPASAHNDTAFPGAANACKGLTPAPNTAQYRRGYQQLLKYSSCMRSHGIADYPDPILNDTGVTISFKKGTGPGEVDTQSSRFQAAQAACKSFQPGGGQ